MCIKARLTLDPDKNRIVLFFKSEKFDKLLSFAIVLDAMVLIISAFYASVFD